MRLSLGIALAFAVFTNLLGGAEEGGFGNITSRNAVVPFYNENQLRLILFGGEINQKADLLDINKATLSLIKPQAPVDKVELTAATPYELRSSIQDVFNFWQNRIVFCDGMLFSGHANIDRTNNHASSNQLVRFRSPAMDIDGMGFFADYFRRVVDIPQDIRIVLRSGASDIGNAAKLGKAPSQDVSIFGRADSMKLDLDERKAILIGNVILDQGNRVVYCDQMTIIMADPAAKTSSANPDDPAGIGAALPAGEIDQIIFDGNLRIEQPKTGTPRQAPWEYYRPAATTPPQAVWRNYYSRNPNKFIPCANETGLTANENDSRLSSDKCVFLYNKNQVVFSGSVKLTDRNRIVNCEKMTVYLKTDSNSGKSKGLDKIICSDDVKVTTEQGALRCEELSLIFVPATEVQTADIPHLSGMLNTGSVLLSRADAVGNVFFESPNPQQPEEVRTLRSAKGSIDFLNDKSTFFGSVRATSGPYAFEADELEFFAEPAKPLSADPTDKSIRQILIGEKMELKQAIGTGDVVISQLDKDSGLRKVTGSQAVYDVRAQKAVMTGTAERPPQMLASESKMTGKSILIDLKTESIEVAQYLYEQNPNK